MPVGTVTNTVSEPIPLKTLPEGFVIVRRMSYGEELQRSAIATKFTVGGSNTKDFGGEVDIQTEKLALWDFANLVVDHNITDEKERKLNFKNEADVRMLSSEIGKEIGDIIDDFNAVKETKEVKNS